MHWHDLATVAQLEQRVYPASAWPLATWWAELAHRPRRYYLVLKPLSGAAAGTVVGYAGLSLAGDVADVMTIAVDPAYRGLGEAGRLLRALHDDARRSGAREVILEVRADNTAARALYAAHGYRTVHVRRGYYQPGAVDALIQRCDLTGSAAPDERMDSEGG
jgi:ribosomal-protein-alanine N-acetyltransferase